MSDENRLIQARVYVDTGQWFEAPVVVMTPAGASLHDNGPSRRFIPAHRITYVEERPYSGWPSNQEGRCPACDSGKRSHRGFPVGGAPVPCDDPWHDERAPSNQEDRG